MLLETDISKMLVNGDEWAAWKGFQLPVSDQYACVWTPIGTKKHWKPGHWKPNYFFAENHSLTYFVPDTWYTIHISYHEDGSFASGYCDIVLPTPQYTSASRELIYTDLYVDVVIRENYSVYTKDQEVFGWAAQKYPIVEESRQRAFEALDFVEGHAKSWTGPFVIIPRRLSKTDFMPMNDEDIRAVISPR
jgi:protein associated with RNAse G/E